MCARLCACMSLRLGGCACACLYLAIRRIIFPTWLAKKDDDAAADAGAGADDDSDDGGEADGDDDGRRPSHLDLDGAIDKINKIKLD